jgi:hypothetical protein
VIEGPNVPPETGVSDALPPRQVHRAIAPGDEVEVSCLGQEVRALKNLDDLIHQRSLPPLVGDPERQLTLQNKDFPVKRGARGRVMTTRTVGGLNGEEWAHISFKEGTLGGPSGWVRAGNLKLVQEVERARQQDRAREELFKRYRKRSIELPDMPPSEQGLGDPPGVAPPRGPGDDVPRLP